MILQIRRIYPTCQSTTRRKEAEPLWNLSVNRTRSDTHCRLYESLKSSSFGRRKTLQCFDFLFFNNLYTKIERYVLSCASQLYIKSQISPQITCGARGDDIGESADETHPSFLHAARGHVLRSNSHVTETMIRIWFPN